VTMPNRSQQLGLVLVVMALTMYAAWRVLS
jgi:hypothetical protein